MAAEERHPRDPAAGARAGGEAPAAPRTRQVRVETVRPGRRAVSLFALLVLVLLGGVLLAAVVGAAAAVVGEVLRSTVG